MEFAALLSHPLVVALVSGFFMVVATAVGLMVKFMFRRSMNGITEAIDNLNTRMINHESSQNELTKRLVRFDVEIENIKNEQVQMEKSSAALARAVHKMLIALPTNYATKDDLKELGQSISKKLDTIEEKVERKPSRDEINAKIGDSGK